MIHVDVTVPKPYPSVYEKFYRFLSHTMLAASESVDTVFLLAVTAT